MAIDPPAGKPATADGVYGFSVDFTFPVHFTRDLWNPSSSLFARVVSRLEPARRHRVLFIVDDQVEALHPGHSNRIRKYFEAYPGVLQLAAPPIVIPGGESAKNDFLFAVKLLRQMNAARLDRQSIVAVIGGGAVLDVGSFAAAIAHRGIRTIRIPTTVLAQDDSGIATKNSVNLFDKKNFAGTFVPPFAVLNDFDYLATLPRRERIAGLSEAVKVALLRDPALFAFIEANATAIADGDPDVLYPVVQRSAELHLAHICGNGDPFELGSARPLDFGHWAAHKLESISAYRVRHGEAVSIGMALDVKYAVKMGFLELAAADRIIRLLTALGLPIWDAALAQHESDGGLTLLAGLQEFREHLGGELHITMLRGIGSSFEVTSMDERRLVESLYELADMARIAEPAPARYPAAIT